MEKSHSLWHSETKNPGKWYILIVLVLGIYYTRVTSRTRRSHTSSIYSPSQMPVSAGQNLQLWRINLLNTLPTSSTSTGSVDTLALRKSSTTDNGSEFIGFEFQEMLESYGIQPVSTTVKNPQANSTIERLHLTLGDQLRCTTFEGSHFLEDVNTIVQACAYAVRTTIPSNSPYSPAQLTFGRDMIFRQQIIVDWENIKQQRLQQAAANNDKENKKRVEHTYSVNDLVLIVTPSSERNKQRKLSSPTEGPYRITKVYANGTVRILRGNFEETMSIRRLRPYHKTG